MGNVTAHSESSQVNQSMFAKESVHDFWLNLSDCYQREVRNSGVWNNSQRRYCCPDDAAGEAGTLASGSVITWSRMVSTCIVITEC